MPASFLHWFLQYVVLGNVLICSGLVYAKHMVHSYANFILWLRAIICRVSNCRRRMGFALCVYHYNSIHVSFN